MLDQQQLQMLVEEISLTYFSMPFKHKASFNPRLRTTGGRYLSKSHDLEFNYHSYEKHGLKELVSIIKHELCHYHLHLQGKGYLHRDRDFKECLLKVGGTRYAKPLKEKKYRYKLTCTQCKQVYLRNKRLNINQYRCGKCGGKLKIDVIKYE